MAKRSQGLSENLEDYLETILSLEKTKKVARVKDIAEKVTINASRLYSIGLEEAHTEELLVAN